jgi:CheY-like chemotaxis protein
VKKVLLIDDDPFVGTVYGRKLMTAGYNVQVATDGAAALLALKSFMPDVVLLDLDLPGVNGIEWLREVRSYPGLKHLPVVVLSAGSHAWQMKAAWESDALYVLSKAITEPQMVVAAVSDAAGFSGVRH